MFLLSILCIYLLSSALLRKFWEFVSCKKNVCLFWINTAVCHSDDFRLLITRAPRAASTCDHHLFRDEPRCPAPSPALAFSLTCPVFLPFLPLLPFPPHPAFRCTASVYVTHVLRMTRLAAILTPHCAEWIGKYRAVEELEHSSRGFQPVTVSTRAERWLYLLQKVHNADQL